MKDNELKLQLAKYKIFSGVQEELLGRIQEVYVIGRKEIIGIIKTKDDEVFTIGPVNHIDTASSMSFLPRKVEELCGQSVKYFAFSNHVVALTDDGKVYSCVLNEIFLRNNMSMRGLTNIRSGGYFSPTIRNIIDVSCGYSHSLILSNKGEVYEWGKIVSYYENHRRRFTLSFEKITCFHEMGICSDSQSCKAPKIVKISCGSHLSAALTEIGEVYEWGRLLDPTDLLNVRTYNQFQPKKVIGLGEKFITNIVCGQAHTLALSHDGYVFAWGDNLYGQLGIGHTCRQYEAQQLSKEILGSVVEVAAIPCYDISAALNEYGEVFVWGRNKNFERVLVPLKKPFEQLNDVFNICCDVLVTWKPIKGNTIASDIVSEVNLIFDDQSTSDLIIKADDNSIFVHKSVLVRKSEYFKCMFQTSWEESKKNEIEIDIYKFAIYKAFLYFLYTGEVNANVEDMFEIAALAEYFCQTNLLNKCEKILMTRLTLMNVANLYYGALEYGLQKLENLSFMFILRFFDKIHHNSLWKNFDDNTMKKLTNLATNYRIIQ